MVSILSIQFSQLIYLSCLGKNTNFIKCNAVWIKWNLQNIYYMCILSASAVRGVSYGFPSGTHVPYGWFYYTPILLWGDAILTIGPYGSAGTCIINYALPQINVVIMAKAVFISLSQCQPYVTINAVSQSTAWFLHNRQHILATNGTR